MSDITHSDELVTKQDLSDFYQGILPYLGGMPEAIANKFSKSDIYSTDEKIIGCWTDGKPLYQKTFTTTVPNCTTDGTDATSYVSIGATVSTIIKTDGRVTFSSGMSSELSFIANTLTSNNRVARILLNAGSNSATTSSEKNKIKLVNNATAYNGLPLTITVQYTKTTDSAVNIGDENDYSTTEKIVGTWIDGKPLYQKTVNCGSISSTGLKTTNHGISNIDSIVGIKGLILKSGSWGIPIPYVSASNQYTSQIALSNINTTAIKIYVGSAISISDWTGGTIYVTLQYTKTTD